MHTYTLAQLQIPKSEEPLANESAALTYSMRHVHLNQQVVVQCNVISLARSNPYRQYNRLVFSKAFATTTNHWKEPFAPGAASAPPGRAWLHIKRRGAIGTCVCACVVVYGCVFLITDVLNQSNCTQDTLPFWAVHSTVWKNGDESQTRAEFTCHIGVLADCIGINRHIVVLADCISSPWDLIHWWYSELNGVRDTF